MLREILLPQLGQTMEEGTIEKWYKVEGETVEKGEVLYDLTTDKATLEVEAHTGGKLLKVFVPEGETAPVNELIAVIGEEDSDVLPDDIEAYRAAVAATLPAPAKPAKEAKPAPAAPAPEPVTAPAAVVAPAPAGKPFASPRAKKIAEEQKVPLAVLTGSGPNGRVIERDVTAYVEALADIRFTPAAREAAYSAGVDLLGVQPAQDGARITKEDVAQAAESGARAARPGERIALTPMRRTIAQRMTQIKQSVPHFYLVGDVQVRALMTRRAELNAAGDVKITVTDLLVRAAALALERHPLVNARFDGNAVVVNTGADVGVAVAVEGGLFVPVIRDAARKDLGAVSTELKSLAAAARAGSLRPDQYEGGSITISNLGMFGVDFFLPIINSPQSCIIGVGKAGEQIVVADGAMRIETVMTLSLSADHRVVDGAQAAEFFRTFRELIEAPEAL